MPFWLFQRHACKFIETAHIFRSLLKLSARSEPGPLITPLIIAIAVHAPFSLISFAHLAYFTGPIAVVGVKFETKI